MLTLSHSNADVERGFSLNKGVQQHNISEESVVSKRHVKDYMVSQKLKPHTVEVTNALHVPCAICVMHIIDHRIRKILNLKLKNFYVEKSAKVSLLS